MGGVLASGVSAGASLAGSALFCCCGSATQGCNQAGHASPTAASTFYVFFIFLATFLAMMLKEYGEGLAEKMTWWGGCTSTSCYGNQAVYRVSFGMVMFFGMMAIVAPLCKALHTGMWGVKMMMLPAFVVGAYFIPSDFYNGFEHWARFISAIFLIIQVFILLEFAYHMHEYLVAQADKADEGREPGFCSNKYRVFYIVLCIVLIVASVGGCIAMFGYFSCSFPMFSVAFTLVAVILCTVLSMTSLGRGLLVGSTISSYMTWLLFSALSSMPEHSKDGWTVVNGVDVELVCNPLATSTDSSWSVYVGIGYACISIGYAGWSAATGAFDALTIESAPTDSIANDERVYKMLAGEEVDVDRDGNSTTPSTDLEAEPKRTNAPAAASGASADAADSSSQLDTKHILLFHVVMVLCGFYMAMVLTNWADTPDEGDEQVALTSRSSMWVKFFSQYLTMVLYVASLVAPVCCPSRFPAAQQ